MCRWERDSFSSEVKITKWIVWIKISKKKIKKKIIGFNSDKSPD